MVREWLRRLLGIDSILEVMRVQKADIESVGTLLKSVENRLLEMNPKFSILNEHLEKNLVEQREVIEISIASLLKNSPSEEPIARASIPWNKRARMLEAEDARKVKEEIDARENYWRNRTVQQGTSGDDLDP